MSKQDQQFDDMLKSARVPDRSAGYWENFPKRVTARLSTSTQPVMAPSSNAAHRWAWVPASAFAVLMLCFGFWMRSRITTAQPNYAKLYREIEAMFPNQVRTIVVDSGAVKLDLSERPDVPSSSPLRVDVCHNQQCRTYITFSGQRIRVNTENWDVLSDGVGNVLVVGRNVAWTSAEPNHRSGAYHIDAEQLGSSS